jgi:sulfate adenylyltransferase subunit 1
MPDLTPPWKTEKKKAIFKSRNASLMSIVQKNKELVRFTTAGSVDDGKSTLIGRLLFDSKALLEDQLSHLRKASKSRGYDVMNLALVADGLKSEREQGITIDVAHLYFSTPRRKYIIADCPGHIQYTRNMVTGASTANVALVLIDAVRGIQEQSRRHAFIASLLQIPHLVFCINKMDLAGWSEDVYENIRAELEVFSQKLKITDISYIPISALQGDNIVERSQNMPWYDGPTLLYYLENVHISGDANLIDLRFPVQLVLRANQSQADEFRGYAGRIAGGVLRTNDTVMLLPSGFESRITEIRYGDQVVDEAFPPGSVVVRLEDDLDVDRGDMIVRKNNQPAMLQQFDIMICWFDHKTTLSKGVKYILRHTTNEARCLVTEMHYKMDINTLHRIPGEQPIGMNDIARISIKTTRPILCDPYQKNRETGSVILIDPVSNQTLAAGMII